MTTMSLDEARKILGKDGDKLSNEQLETDDCYSRSPCS